jgi:cystathionine gamma-lyase
VVRTRELAERLGYLQNAIGGVLDPLSSYLVLRGIRTLPLRMQRHCANALQIAQWLETQAVVAQVLYPGLASHPQHALAHQLFPQGFGGMVSFRLRADESGVRRFLSALNIVKLAESLGAVESLICQPWKMSHGSLPEAERLARDIDPSLLRLSVGVEHVTDLIADLQQAFSSL